MKFFLVTILLIICISGFSQKNLKKEIHWKEARFEKNESEIKYFLNFTGATYNENFLPVFCERIKLTPNSNFADAKIENQIYIPFSDNEIENIQDLNKISTDPEIKTHIQFEKKQPYLSIDFIPIRKNTSTNKYEKLVSFTIVVSEKFDNTIKSINRTYSQNSVLNSGKWVKIKTDRDGIYKITFDELKGMGIQNPSNISVYGNGGGQLPLLNKTSRPDDLVQNAISIQDVNGDGAFNTGDYLLFYGQGSTKWKYDTTSHSFSHIKHQFSDFTYYYLTDSKNLKLIAAVNSLPNANTTVNSFDDYTVYETDSINLIKSGSLWLARQFDLVTSQNLNFYFPNIESSSPVKLNTHLLARSSNSASQNSRFLISANGVSLLPVSITAVNTSQNTNSFAHEVYSTVNFNSGSDNIYLNFTYEKPASSSQGWLDYLNLIVRRKLLMYGSQMIFRDSKTIGSGKSASFNLGNANTNTKIWNITDPFNVTAISPLSNENNTIIFNVSTDSLRQFIAFDGLSYLTPTVVGEVPNQNLHGIPKTDMIIVSHPDFKTYADQLAEHHRTVDNLIVTVVKPEEIYNEFSSGSPDVSAIRDFMKMLYDRAGTDSSLMPRYLLLYGDGSYDNTHSFANNSNYILTYQSANSLDPTASYVSDDFYTLLDNNEGTVGGNETMDLGVGRFPVKTQDEAKLMLDKVLNYTSTTSLGEWRNSICLVGDDEDGGQHQSQTNELATLVDTLYKNYNIDKIFLDAYQQSTTPTGDRYPDVNIGINNRIKKGTLLFNYTGHGNETGLAHEKVVTTSDIASWDNWSKLTVFITATCEFSRFDDFSRTSAGEQILLNNKGGAIALFSTTRLVYSSPNAQLNQSFYDYIFKHDNSGTLYRLGDVMRHSKNDQGGNSINKRNFSLLGDPAIQIAIPKYEVKTTSINNHSIINNLPLATGADTIKALSKVTISGSIYDHNGTKQSGFNGIIYPSVYDKYLYTNTRGNDIGTPKMSYKAQNKILFKGKASVKNGDFTFSFIVPKDISYNVGYGKISYYSDNALFDAAGNYKGVVIGGSSTNSITDNQGPAIQLYLNDDKFVFGGITDERPKLLAYVTDLSGINTVGNGIGHDITAILDGNTNQTLILNDFYESDLDSYQKGKIKYDFSNLAIGRHNIKVKVWDVNNNSSDSYTEFIVASSAELVLDHIFNYPNPFTTNTSFYFDHNLPNTELDVFIQVFTITGKLVKTLEGKVNSTGFRSTPISWDGHDDFGDKIGRGVYIYRLKVRPPTGKIVDKFEKLVILK